MAVLWRKIHEGITYEVRSAGRSRRLYVNGHLNTQYHPDNIFSGSLWDLMALPVLLKPDPPRRILVLGVGGGAVIHQLEHLFSPSHIVGVDLNPLHISLAKRFFNLRMPHLDLLEGDARRWVREYRGAPFDLIIDDLFGEEDGEARRAVKADAPWIQALLSRLAPGGMLVFNHENRADLRGSAGLSDPGIGVQFGDALALSGPLFENEILVLCRERLPGPVTRNKILSRFRTRSARGSHRLRFSLRRLLLDT